MPSPFRFNPFDAELRRDPYATYARARLKCPALRSDGLPVVSVFCHRDVQEILRDAKTWSSSFPDQRPERRTEGDLAPSMLGLDAPEHTRLRALVGQAFTPRMIQSLRQRIEEIAEELVAEAVEQRQVDLVAALSHPLPMVAISEIIGIPPEDRAEFKRWSETLIESLGSGIFDSGPSQATLDRDGRVIDEMRAYFGRMARDRSARPRDDLLSGLVAAETEGSKLSFEEMLSMLVLLLIAGNETTTSLISNTVLELLEHPDALARLRADPAWIPAAVDEVMRFSSPVQMDPRRATRDVEVCGVKIRRDEYAVCWLGSANRDEQVFANPERFDIERAAGKHLGFGFGPHYCLGANLARLEAQVAIRTLLEQTDGFERTDSSPLPLHPSIVFRGVGRLPLELQPRSGG